MSKVIIAGDVNGTGVFTIAAPNGNTNRTLTLPDEAGTVLTSVSSITSSQLTGDAAPIGVGQTWTDVLASRTLNTTYTNTTGRPISVAVTVIGVGGSSRSTAYIVLDGTNFGFVHTNDYYTASAITPGRAFLPFIVPAGVTYRITTNLSQSIAFWYELV
jgi:hypothetical protein